VLQSNCKLQRESQQLPNSLPDANRPVDAIAVSSGASNKRKLGPTTSSVNFFKRNCWISSLRNFRCYKDSLMDMMRTRTSSNLLHPTSGSFLLLIRYASEAKYKTYWPLSHVIYRAVSIFLHQLLHINKVLLLPRRCALPSSSLHSQSPCLFW
jgi:hypothetical protein